MRSVRRLILSDRWVDLDQACVVVDGAHAHLTPTEIRILTELARAEGATVARETLWRTVWAGEPSPQSRAIDVAMRRLRTKLEPNPDNPIHLTSVYGVGYRLCSRDTAATTAQPVPPAGARRTNLVPLTTPIRGRAEALARLGAMLGAGDRFVTLVGPAGVGKSTLASALLLELMARDAIGEAWRCDLASISSAHELALKLAATLAIPLTTTSDETDVVAAIGADLRRRRATVILCDNAETCLVSARSVLGALHDAAPSLTIMCTSRVALRLGDERAFLVALLEAGAAVALFCDRAERALPVAVPRPRFDVPVVAALVEALDRLPLAIELAAARSALLTPGQLLERLQHRFEVLRDPTGHHEPRHASLRASIDVSWRLLSADDKRVFAACGVFVGSFTLDGVASVSGRQPEGEPVLDALHRLSTQSLISALTPTEARLPARFRLLESLRAYALTSMSEGDAAELVERHGDHYAGLVARALSAIHEASDTTELMLLAEEADNLRAALGRSTGRAKALAALGLAALYETSGPARQALALTAFAVDEADRLNDHALIVEARLARSRAVYLFRPKHEASLDAARALELARDIGDPSLLGRALLQMGVVREAIADGSATAALIEAEQCYRGCVHPAGRARALALLAWLAARRGDNADAVAIGRRAVEMYTLLGPTRGHAIALNNLAASAIDGGVADAREIAGDALRMNRLLGYHIGESAAMRDLAVSDLLDGRCEAAREALNVCVAIEGDSGHALNLAWSLVCRAALDLVEGMPTEALADLARATPIAVAHDACLAVRCHALRALALVALGLHEGAPPISHRGVAAALAEVDIALDRATDRRLVTFAAYVRTALTDPRAMHGADARMWEIRALDLITGAARAPAEHVRISQRES